MAWTSCNASSPTTGSWQEFSTAPTPIDGSSKEPARSWRGCPMPGTAVTSTSPTVPGTRTPNPGRASAVAQEASVAEAVAELTAAADRDLGDHFRFEITRTSPLQEQALGRRVDLVAYLGTRYAAFHVDVVLGTAMTGPPEQFPPLIPLHIEGLIRPRYQLFPLADHVADKVCATFEVHTRAGGQQPSTRVKDLVDLTLIASTQTIEGAALHTAITVGAAHRRLTLPDRFAVPDLDVWRAGYPAKAREAPGATPGFDDAVVLVGRFLDPILAGHPVSTWDPRHTAWTTPATP
jgi:hypothetical protein